MRSSGKEKDTSTMVEEKLGMGGKRTGRRRDALHWERPKGCPGKRGTTG